MSAKPATTALCIDNGAIVAKPGGAARHYARFMSEPGSPQPSDRLRYPELEDGITSRLDVVEQGAADRDVAVTLGHEIGKGTFGVVYACTVQLASDRSVHQLALKLPNKRKLNYAFDDMITEFENAERLLEPTPVLSLRRAVGGPLPPMPAAAYFRMVAARCRHASHVGYQFLHRPIQFFYGFTTPDYAQPVPAILSERADGTLHDLINGCQGLRVRPDGTPSLLWLVSAWQVLHGVRYMVHECGLAHVDLKPNNVFFQGDPDAPTSLRCLIGDFGMIEPVGALAVADVQLADHMRFNLGVRRYSPYVTPLQPHQMTCGLYCDYQCLTTLASLFVLAPPVYHEVWHASTRNPYEYVPAAFSLEMKRTSIFDSITSSPLRTLLDFCDGVNEIHAWELLDDICWRQLLPQVDELLRAQAPEVCARFEERASAYARDAEEATRCAEVYERELVPMTDADD